MNNDILDKICQQLAAHPNVSEWVTSASQRNGTQLYLIGSEPEASRELSSNSYEVTIYSDRGDRRGEATFKISASEIANLSAKLDEAVFMAGLSLNPHWSLPTPAASYPDIPMADPTLASVDLAEATAAELREQAVAALQDEPGLRLSGFELFLDRSRNRLRSSTGLDLSSTRTQATLEMVLVAHADGTESEAFVLRERRRAADLDLTDLLQEQATAARDSLKARLPRTGLFPVAIDADAFLPFFGSVYMRSSASARLRGATQWEPGQPLIKGAEPGAYDPLTISIDPTLPYGGRSYRADGDTLPGQPFTLVESGVLQRYWATARYAQYLGVEPTGELGNVVLGAGARPAADLLVPDGDTPLYHIVAFSWLTPDRVTGEFSGEIRLGYEITPTGITPIRGGAISGNVFQGLTHARFSRESTFLGDYSGPALARFDTFSVAGE